MYQNDTLQFIGHEEGRIRLVRVDSAVCTPQPNRIVYDYFLKDHLGSVRMVLTEQKEDICYPAATVEDARLQKESAFFNIVNGRRIDKATTGATQTSFENKLYRVHGGLANEKTGLGIVLKVMAGDKVKIMAESFYTLPGGGAGSPLTLAVTELLAAFTGSSAITANKGVLTPAQVSGIGTNNADLGNFISNNNPGANNAKAFVNYLLFDEQLKYISGAADPVLVGGGYKLHNTYINSPLTIARNGYIYVYVSNESNLPVYFDNLAVTHTPGPILEETHYYPFGLTMAGISSKAVGKMYNKYKFNGIEQNNDLSLSIYEAFYRSLDPQIGRFWQIDTKPTYWESPYASMKNNPVLNSDPLGDTIIIVYINEFVPAMAKYSNGKLTQSDGKPLSNDLTGYGTKVYNDLKRIDNSGDKELSKRMGEMADSENNHYISMTPSNGKGNRNKPESQEKDDKNVSTGSTTLYDPDNKVSPIGEKRDPAIALTHELLGHGYNTDKGTSSQGMTNNGISINEVSGVNIENRARAKLNAPKKTTYSGTPIPSNLLDDTHKKKKK
ncbi:RHS repeat-associated core domain-containing protein [Paraflavitalea speifideaquila]|uniref:RHS repeat-associated core domain-containing protein n=1 Tax=Paraflavitalea speifideaquila TaxID=3076558 RepID=UPI0028EDFDCD|nr:RHS repeat-associated core domain-containing protein [Paraflavitalea speifideiaquila]